MQQRLFPQHLPVVEGLDLAAYCRPQQGVGGDYYDFLSLENRECLGIAIGDVSGKGIGAALTMATLQASLRGRTISQSGSVAGMIELINKLLYEASASNRYATFFYAQYYPKTRLLRYVNAGHNAPIVAALMVTARRFCASKKAARLSGSSGFRSITRGRCSSSTETCWSPLRMASARR